AGYGGLMDGMVDERNQILSEYYHRCGSAVWDTGSYSLTNRCCVRSSCWLITHRQQAGKDHISEYDI
ncbi:hypothetical protein, partial [Halarchaeum acidiphilum]|uniref:hypothetical protein n=1 Tax=Halarchaeum acidiphilum TaxID=489138 RepID=UPI001F2D9E45